jgi:hypothetical protein
LQDLSSWYIYDIQLNMGLGIVPRPVSGALLLAHFSYYCTGTARHENLHSSS